MKDAAIKTYIMRRNGEISRNLETPVVLSMLENLFPTPSPYVSAG